MPDYVTINYSCVVQTYYTDQLNKIVEAINYASDSYWGNPERFKFRARIRYFNFLKGREYLWCTCNKSKN